MNHARLPAARPALTFARPTAPGLPTATPTSRCRPPPSTRALTAALLACQPARTTPAPAAAPDRTAGASAVAFPLRPPAPTRRRGPRPTRLDTLRAQSTATRRTWPHVRELAVRADEPVNTVSVIKLPIMCARLPGRRRRGGSTSTSVTRARRGHAGAAPACSRASRWAPPHVPRHNRDGNVITSDTRPRT